MPDANLVAIRMRLTGGSEVAAEAKAANAEIAKTGTTAKAAGAASASASAKIAKTATSLKSAGRGLSTYLSLPLAAVGVASGMMALDFDRSMRNVNSIAQLPERQFNSLKQHVLDLAGPTAQAPKTLAEGLYDLVSSGFNARESMIILHSSALAASAGLTTTEVSTKAVAAALNAYHLPAKKAAGISDTLFETVNRGVLTFDELSTTIGDVLPFASQLGVNLNEVGASIATMTKQGLSSAESVTRLKNTMVSLIKPSKPLAELLGEMGTTGQGLVNQRGFQGALEAIMSHTNGTKEALAELFPNIRSMGGVLALTGKSAKSAAEDLAAFKDTTGATNTVLKQQEQSFGFQLQRSWAKLQAVLIELGTTLLPIVVPFILQLAEAGASVVEWFSQLPAPLQHVALGVAALAIVIGPLLFAVGSLIGAFAALDVLASPWLALAAGAIVLAVGLGILYAKSKLFRTVAPFLIGAFLPMVGITLLVVQHLDWLKNAFNNVVGFFQRLPGRVMSGIHALPHLVGVVVGTMIKYWLTLPIRVPIFIVQMGIKLVHALLGIAPSSGHAAVRIASAIAHGVASGASAVWGWVKMLPGKFASAVASIAGQLVQIGTSIASQIASGIKQGLSNLLPGPVKDALGAASGVASEIGGFIGINAQGTDNWRGGLSLVGEQGPEIVNLPRGAQVVPAARTRTLLAPFDGTPRAAALAGQVRGSGTGTRLAVPVIVKVGRRELTSVVVETQEDAQARL